MSLKSLGSWTGLCFGTGVIEAVFDAEGTLREKIEKTTSARPAARSLKIQYNIPSFPGEVLHTLANTVSSNI